MVQQGLHITATIQIGGFDSIARDLRKPSFLRKTIKRNIQKAVRLNFSRSGRPTRWAKLAPSTVRKRKRMGTWMGSRKSILRETSKLYMDSVTRPIIDVRGTTFMYSVRSSGRGVPRWQQFGSPATWKSGMPIPSQRVSSQGRGKSLTPRPFMGLTTMDVNKMSNDIKNIIIARARRNKRVIKTKS